MVVRIAVPFAVVIVIVIVVAVGALPIAQADKAADRARADHLDAEAGRLIEAQRPDDALPVLERALALRERSDGTHSAAVAVELFKLGQIYTDRGELDRAQDDLERALAIYHKVPGRHDLPRYLVLDALGVVHVARGDLARARSVVEEALAIAEKVDDHRQQLVAHSLLGVANIAWALGNPDDAVAPAQRALELREQAFGSDDLRLVENLRALAAIQFARRNYEAAAAHTRRAGKLAAQAYAPESLELAMTRVGAATLLLQAGDHEGAAELYRAALATFTRLHGENSDSVAACWSGLGTTYAQAGDRSRAVEAMTNLGEIRERRLAMILTRGSADDKAQYWSTLTAETSAMVSLNARSFPDHPAATRLALTTVLRRKGRLLDTMTDIEGRLRASLEGEDGALLDRLRARRTELATVALSAGADPARVATLEAEVGALEAEMSTRSAAFRVVAQPATIAAVQAALPQRAALVEIVRYEPFDVRTFAWLPARYAAYVLRRDGPPRLVDLGEAGRIDDEVARYRVQIGSPGAVDPARGDLYGLARDEHGELTLAPLGRALEMSLVEPLRGALGDATHVFLSPDGELNLLPFGALADVMGGRGRYLVESYTFTYLTSGRDLLRLQATQADGRGVIVIGAPEFGPAPRDGIYFAPLPGTEQEAAGIAGVFRDATVITGIAATERAVEQVDSPRILHLATHGFFLDGSELNQIGRGLVVVGPTSIVKPAPTRGLVDPLLRSGLALAGANREHSGEADGLLTALEVSGLRLSGTKLVVLSACDSGVGGVGHGDGVYGLRRALVIAGAETLVMSLWKVDDVATRDLMLDYYRRLRAGDGRSEALRQAQLAMLARPETAAPYFWAAFIVSGEPAPLDAPSVTRGMAVGRRGCGCRSDGDPASPWLLVFVIAAVAGKACWSCSARGRTHPVRRRCSPRSIT